MKAGAHAYILKGNVRDDLFDTIRAVQAGRKILHAEVAAELATHAGDDALSAREIEVLSLIAAGNSNKLIAEQLAIAEVRATSRTFCPNLARTTVPTP